MKLRTYFLLVMLVAVIQAGAQGEWGNIKGTVTYGSDNGSLHADIGAEMIIFYIDSVMQPGNEAFNRHHSDDSIISNAILATSYYELWEHSPIGKTQKQMVKKLKRMDAWPAEKVRELDSKAAAIIADRERRLYARAIIDVNGHYNMNLKPGYYGIMARSKHLRTHWRVEYRGKIVLDRVYIRARQSVMINEEIL